MEKKDLEGNVNDDRKKTNKVVLVIIGIIVFIMGSLAGYYCANKFSETENKGKEKLEEKIEENNNKTEGKEEEKEQNKVLTEQELKVLYERAFIPVVDEDGSIDYVEENYQLSVNETKESSKLDVQKLVLVANKVKEETPAKVKEGNDGSLIIDTDSYNSKYLEYYGVSNISSTLPNNSLSSSKDGAVYDAKLNKVVTLPSYMNQARPGYQKLEYTATNEKAVIIQTVSLNKDMSDSKTYQYTFLKNNNNSYYLKNVTRTK